ncbi:DUF2000 domain-containing protein [Amycolatopsis acididurans]|uniref:DUF2000 domain-containing protein n=1 Tax=Amycolatopsis acididurans TaxID=2724524 RepID=UPI0028AA0E09|nr:DUF2000 domain-containing protein [Amycolatopsis acididurans]
MTIEHQELATILEEDARTGVTTRTARLKWVIVADPGLGSGLVANAVACLGAAVGAALPGVVGEAVPDAAGSPHAGLPWGGVSILAADGAKIREIRAKAVTRDGVFVADMTKHAQASTSYEEYTASLAVTGEPDYYAISLLGPRNKIGKLVGGLPLLR